MDIQIIEEIFIDHPVKMSNLQRGTLLRMISVCKAADLWLEDQDEDTLAELKDALENLRDYD